MNRFTPPLCASRLMDYDRTTMPRAFSNCSRAILALSLLTLVGSFLCGEVWADEELDSECSQSVTVTDLTCTGGHDCLSTTGCASQTFTASCTGRYTINANTVCTGGGNCASLNACVNVYDSGGNRIGSNCHLNPCDCAQQCTQAVCLLEDQQYTLYVCLVPCAPDDACPTPMPNCYASGKISYCGAPTVCQ